MYPLRRGERALTLRQSVTHESKEEGGLVYYLPVVVEVGHLPAVLLVVVVVRVRRVVGRRDALGVRRGSAVVKVDLNG